MRNLPTLKAMNSKKEWTIDESRHLIELYRQHTNLWDAKTIDYQDRNKRLDSLKQIGSVFKTSSYEVDRKIKNLVSQYKREKRRFKRIKKSGAGRSTVSTWFGYHAMSFLPDNKPMKRRQGGSNLVTGDTDGSSDSGLNDTQSQSTTCGVDEESGGSLLEMPSGILDLKFSLCDEQAAVGKEDHSFTVPKCTAKKPKLTATNVHQEAYDMMKSVNHSREREEVSMRDDYEVFGELVGRKVRRLKTDYAKATVQHLINNILYEGEVGKYDVPVSIHYPGTSTSSSFGSPSHLFIDIE